MKRYMIYSVGWNGSGAGAAGWKGSGAGAAGVALPKESTPKDLPNFAQHPVPIFSLPQEWLWCESWCGNSTKSKAKTIVLCNDPMTKEPKLQIILVVPFVGGRLVFIGVAGSERIVQAGQAGFETDAEGVQCENQAH